LRVDPRRLTGLQRALGRRLTLLLLALVTQAGKLLKL